MVRDAVPIPQPEFRFSVPFSITMALALKPLLTAVGGYLCPVFMVSVLTAGVAPIAVRNTIFPVGTVTVRLPLPLNGQIGGIHIQSGVICGLGNRNGILAFQRDCCVALHRHRGSYVSVLLGNSGDGFMVCRTAIRDITALFPCRQRSAFSAEQTGQSD